MKEPVDLRKEILKSEAEFYESIDKINKKNEVAFAILDSLQNENYNGVIINSGYDKDGVYYIELANVLNPAEQYRYRLGRIKPARAERFKAGAILNMHWEKGRADPMLNIRYNSKKPYTNLKMLGYFADCYYDLCDVFDPETSSQALYNALDAITMALDNYYYNLEFNDTDYNSAVSNQIAELVKFQTLSVYGDLDKYYSITKNAINTISNGLKLKYIDEVSVSKMKYEPSLGMQYHDFNRSIEKPDLFYFDNRIVRSLSDLHKLKRLDTRLSNPELCAKTTLPEILKRDGSVLSYLVIADCSQVTPRGDKRHYLHLLCLDSFSRDFMIPASNIENSSRLHSGSLFNARMVVDNQTGATRFIDTEILTQNNDRDRLNNIIRLKNLVDLQKKYTENPTIEDMEDFKEADDYILFTLKQYCSEIGLDESSRRELMKIEGKKEHNSEQVYNRILGIAKNGVANLNQPNLTQSRI